MAKRKKRRPKENALDESFRRLDGTLDKIAFMNYLARFSRMMNDPENVVRLSAMSEIEKAQCREAFKLLTAHMDRIFKGREEDK